MQGQKENKDKILVTIMEASSGFGLFGGNKHSLHVPRQANVHYLKSCLMRKSNSKDSIFLFAYGVILNNNETVGSLCQKFKQKVKQSQGLKIEVAALASF